MHWLIDKVDIVFIFLILLFLGLYFSSTKKNKANLDNSGFPLFPSDGDIHYNELGKCLYVFQENWIPLSKLPIVDLKVVTQYDYEDQGWKAIVNINFQGEIEECEYWGETEETAISKACCNITHILLSKLEDK